MSTETLRSSWTLDGTRIFLQFDPVRGLYRLATRWYWLTSFTQINDACEAFEALEMSEGDHCVVAKRLKHATRLKRSPAATAMSRIHQLLSYVEQHLGRAD